MARPRAARLDDVDAARARRRRARSRSRRRSRESAAARRPRRSRPARRRRGSRRARRSSGRRAPRCAPVPICDDERAELIGEPDPRLQPLQLVGMDRRKVHRVAHDAVAQEVADGRRRLDADQFLRLFGRRRDVRRRDHLRQLGERPIGRRLLFRRRRGRRRRRCRCRSRGAAPSSSIELAARRIDDPDARLAAREALVVEEMLRFRRRRQVQRQVVGGRAHLVERQQLDAEAGGDLLAR